MIEYKCEFARDRLDLFETIYEIESQYQDYPTLKREMRIFFRGQTRLITAWYNDEVLGHYIYCPLSMYTVNPKWMSLKAKIDVDIDKCSLPLFAHFIPGFNTIEHYVDINFVKTRDAITQGYHYSLIGINSSNRDNSCLQREWINIYSVFAENSQTQFKMIDYKMENGDQVYVEIY